MPRVSVIIPTHNSEKTIGDTLDSILIQTFADFEIIVVDDASVDRTLDVIEIIKDPRIKVIKLAKNTGSPVAGRNKAIGVARGELIALCDHDDLWYSEKLEKQLKAYDEAERKKEIGIIYASADIINEKGNKIMVRSTDHSGFLPQKKAFGDMLNGDFITACSAIFPKKVFDEMGPLDEGLVGVDDYDFWLRVTQKYGVLALPEVLCAWRQTAKNLSADKEAQYKKNEPVFGKLEKENQSEEVRFGHGKNLFRIFAAQLLENNFKEADRTQKIFSNYPKSKKISFILTLYRTSPKLASLSLSCLQKIGRFSL